MTSKTLRGKSVPEKLRSRGIRWINPAVFRLNFEHEQRLRAEGFAAGFVAGSAKTDKDAALKLHSDSMCDKHCKSHGFSPQEFEKL